MRQVSVLEAARLLASADAPQLVDCRERWEHELVALPGSILLPLGELAEGLDQLDPARPVLVYCHHGVRSLGALALLEAAGFAGASVAGGIEAWALQVDPKLRRY